MAPNILPPDPHALLPPLLACLPTAFVSPRPPPTLLLLLSPILRQRVTLMSVAPGESSDASWLPLLCWDSREASNLVATVETTTFEPHPVSGEIELGDIDGPVYQRLDRETLQAQIKVQDLNLLVIYVWCEWEKDDGGVGWLVSEVRALDSSAVDSVSWQRTIREANEQQPSTLGALDDGPDRSANGSSNITIDQGEGEDDYWAQYDNTPSQGKSSNPSNRSMGDRALSSEADHYARYADVQPALDNDDPSERPEAEALAQRNVGDAHDLSQRQAGLETDIAARGGDWHANTDAGSLIHTRPSTSHSSPDVARIEDSAEAQSHAEIAVQQHISTSLKSLFRLAKASGMQQGEFHRIVKTELEVLSMVSEDD